MQCIKYLNIQTCEELGCGGVVDRLVSSCAAQVVWRTEGVDLWRSELGLISSKGVEEIVQMDEKY